MNDLNGLSQEFLRPLDLDDFQRDYQLSNLQITYTQDQIPDIFEQKVEKEEEKVEEQQSLKTSQGTIHVQPIKKGKKSQYKDAQNPDLIEQAKVFLTENNFNLELMLSQEQFRPLLGTADLSKFIKKFIINKKS